MKSNNKGFSLVELIVVIAIMAVLAAVAVIGVSVYIPKAQQAADQQLVSDIEQLLNLYYQGEPNVTGGYIILKPNGGEAVASPELEAQLQAAYGENWKKELSLAHDGWTGNDLMDVVAKYDPEDAELIMNSTFMQNPEGMLEATTNLLGMASDKISGTLGNAESYLDALDPELNATLEKLGLEPGTEGYEEAVANLLVGHFANAMKPSTEQTPGEDGDDPTQNVSKLATFYAQVYAFSEKYEKDSESMTMIEKLDELINDSGYGTISGEGNVAGYMDALYEHNSTKFTELAHFLEGNNDREAFTQMMEAVSVVANGYKNDADALKNGDLYSSVTVKDQVNQLANALTARAEGTFPAADQVGTNDVLIILYPDGKIDCTID